MEIINQLNTILGDYQAAIAERQARVSSQSALEAVRSITKETVDFNASYVLDLSSAAQAVLSQQNGAVTTGVIGSLTLSQGQIRKLEAVLSAYENAPLNEETASTLYVDLKAAGLLPSQIVSSYETTQYSADEIVLELLGARSSKDGLGARTTFSSLLGDDSILTKNSSEKLVTTLLRYGEITSENRSYLLNSKVNAYLDLFDQGGIIT